MSNNNTCKIFALIAVVGVFSSLSAASFAQQPEVKPTPVHPRRAEVNHRLATQDNRIKTEVKNGTMSKGEARKLHHEDHQIRHEEHAMASQDGGHITKQEQKTLNQQENGVSRQIGK